MPVWSESSVCNILALLGCWADVVHKLPVQDDYGFQCFHVASKLGQCTQQIGQAIPVWHPEVDASRYFWVFSGKPAQKD